jgi:hypothetical protein
MGLATHDKSSPGITGEWEGAGRRRQHENKPKNNQGGTRAVYRLKLPWSSPPAAHFLNPGVI